MFCVRVCMCVGVCLEALEVHLRNMCQGSSVITSVKGGGERNRTARRKRRGETDGEISGEGRAIKREGERGNIRDRGNMGGTYRFEGKGWNSPGEDVRKLSLLGLAPPTDILACVH